MKSDARHEVIVVGAGPAGIAAATTLSSAGVDTLLVDDQPEPGGQIYRAIERNAGRADRAFLGPDYFRGVELARAFRASPAKYRPLTSVVNIEAGQRLWLANERGLQTASASYVLLATGAMERPVPVPGWTLPGVITAGAAQILLKRDGLVPDMPMVLVGTGPLFYLLAQQCLEAGASVSAIVDTARATNLLAAASSLPRALTGQGPHYLLKGLSLMHKLARSGLPRYANVTDLRLEGDGQVRKVSFRTGGRQVEIPAGLIVLHEGVIPAQQVTRAAGCDHDWDEIQQCFHPVRGIWGDSSVDGLFIAGDAGGISGARAAELQGRLAAHDILRRLGHIDAAQRDDHAAGSWRELHQHQAVRTFLDKLYRPRQEILQPAGNTIVCRCEEVSAASIRKLADNGLGPNQIKSALRCGMGLCQGRICGPVVSRLSAAAQAGAPAQAGYFTIRAPLKPIALGALADMDLADD